MTCLHAINIATLRYTGSFMVFDCTIMYMKMCEALTFLLDNIYIRFGFELYRQIVGIPVGTNCAPLVADLFLFCYERLHDGR